MVPVFRELTDQQDGGKKKKRARQQLNTAKEIVEKASEKFLGWTWGWTK